ncbi:NADH dehydrogenase [ubiquinone] iron-sulfur protein 4, mitochondrial [Cephus cinctus]|uniref:NADH dehydrogenase [ubiquinone] iron-sulfur protein 4, mitochondrial n=1 Tax=Cephus cinctus TaxID=211228 RepID=A0AAJ7FHV8_CEPCN|nr:NADH dehydrogenase [ubiquinone] iron-sulfur protein 4, mitochondrial [Cephus cinctus]
MGSRILLRQCVKELRNNNKQWIERAIATNAQCNTNKLVDINKALEVPEAEQESTEKFLNPMEFDRQQQLKKYIAVSSQENIPIVTGIPEEHIKTRRVRIYQPPKNAMQSGTNNIHNWQIDYDTRERWENPLMGWTSSGDPLSNLKVEFATKEEAIAHCIKMQYEYEIQKPNRSQPKPRSYGENFSWNKRTRVSTK